MIRFISRILLVTAFFIGLGGIVDTASKSLFSSAEDFVFDNEQDCPRQRIRMIRVDRDARPANADYQIRMILPGIDETAPSESEKTDEARRIVIIKQSPSI